LILISLRFSRFAKNTSLVEAKKKEGKKISIIFYDCIVWKKAQENVYKNIENIIQYTVFIKLYFKYFVIILIIWMPLVLLLVYGCQFSKNK
jgi:hypothetical protein